MCDYKGLMSLAKEASKNSYAPYSKFHVGACVLAESGKTYKGCNFENASYGMAICAERCAIGSAIVNGEKKIKVVAIYSPNMDDCTPCGACRQVINEFKSKDGVKVITEVNGELKTYEIEYLLPESFSL